jgi:hypothetical protein
MRLFTTLAVFDSAERGNFVKLTYPFSHIGKHYMEIIREVLIYTPNVFQIFIPGRGLLDVQKRTFRYCDRADEFWKIIETYEERIINFDGKILKQE